MNETIDWDAPRTLVKATTSRQRLLDAAKQRAEQAESMVDELSSRLSRIRQKARAMTIAPTWEEHKAGEVIEQLALGYGPKPVDMSGRGINDHLQEIGRGTRAPKPVVPLLSPDQITRMMGTTPKEARELLTRIGA